MYSPRRRGTRAAEVRVVTPPVKLGVSRIVPLDREVAAQRRDGTALQQVQLASRDRALDVDGARRCARSSATHEPRDRASVVIAERATVRAFDERPIGLPCDDVVIRRDLARSDPVAEARAASMTTT